MNRGPLHARSTLSHWLNVDEANERILHFAAHTAHKAEVNDPLCRRRHRMCGGVRFTASPRVHVQVWNQRTTPIAVGNDGEDAHIDSPTYDLAKAERARGGTKAV